LGTLPGCTPPSPLQIPAGTASRNNVGVIIHFTACIRLDTILLQYPNEYRVPMFTVLRTDEFAQWLDDLKDSKTRARLLRRLEKAEQGNLGDV
jgi:hypothetical protein